MNMAQIAVMPRLARAFVPDIKVLSPHFFLYAITGGLFGLAYRYDIIIKRVYNFVASLYSC